MSDTYFTASPHWTWWIVAYFFVGGIAGGSYFLAALLSFFGRPQDRRVVRLGYYVAVIGAVISGILLVLDPQRPERFWHMLFQSEQFPALSFKYWSPISVGAWVLLLFGLFAALSALGALAEEGRLRWKHAHRLHSGVPGALIVTAGAFFGFFLAGYTGVLLSVSNRPIWADSSFVGVLFLVSAASTAAATLILLARRWGEQESRGAIAWLVTVDAWILVLELIVLLVFLVSLGSVARAWLSPWGAVLLVGVVLLGILAPLGLHYRPASFARWTSRPQLVAAALVLLGGLLLRMAVLLSSNAIEGRSL
jgi:protein NrfD